MAYSAVFNGLNGGFRGYSEQIMALPAGIEPAT